MRRNEKEIKDMIIIIDVLNRCHIGRLGTIGEDGYPMVKPLNFAYHEETLNPPSSTYGKGGMGGFAVGKIYFHTAKQGEKIDDIKRDNRVCFEVDLPIAYVKALMNMIGKIGQVKGVYILINLDMVLGKEK